MKVQTKQLDKDQYSEREAQRRFMATLKTAVNTPRKQLKDIPKRNGESRAKTQRKARKGKQGPP